MRITSKTCGAASNVVRLLRLVEKPRRPCSYEPNGWVSCQFLGSCARTRPVGWSVISLEVASALPGPGELVWLKHNGVYRLKTQSLIDHIQHAESDARGRCGRRARHSSPHPKD